MRTRDVLRWHFKLRDVGVLLAGAAIAVLDAACSRLEAWVDGEGEHESEYNGADDLL